MNEKFQKFIIDVHGGRGREWLDALPDLLRKFCRKWSVTLERPFRDLTYHYVAPGSESDGTLVVVKTGPGSREFQCAVAALKVFAGRSAVQLIENDAEAGIMLLERVLPGNTLWHNNNDKQNAVIAAGVMGGLWRSVPETVDRTASGYIYRIAFPGSRTHSGMVNRAVSSLCHLVMGR